MTIRQFFRRMIARCQDAGARFQRDGVGKARLLEIVFARVMMVDGVGMAVVYSHRTYGTHAPKVAGEWLKTNGPEIENALMKWDKMRSAGALKQLPQSK